MPGWVRVPMRGNNEFPLLAGFPLCDNVWRCVRAGLIAFWVSLFWVTSVGPSTFDTVDGYAVVCSLLSGYTPGSVRRDQTPVRDRDPHSTIFWRNTERR